MDDSQKPKREEREENRKSKRIFEKLGLDLSLLIHTLRMGFTLNVSHEERNGKPHLPTWLIPLIALIAVVGCLSLMALWSFGLLGWD